MLPIAMAALMRRVADPGLLVIHCHNSHDTDREITQWLQDQALRFGRIRGDRALQVKSFSPRVVALLATSG